MIQFSRDRGWVDGWEGPREQLENLEVHTVLSKNRAWTAFVVSTLSRLVFLHRHGISTDDAATSYGKPIKGCETNIRDNRKCILRLLMALEQLLVEQCREKEERGRLRPPPLATTIAPHAPARSFGSREEGHSLAAAEVLFEEFDGDPPPPPPPPRSAPEESDSEEDGGMCVTM